MSVQSCGDSGSLVFDQGFVDHLPADLSSVNAPREVREACYTLVLPSAVTKPSLLAWSNHAARPLGITKPADDAAVLTAVLAGNQVLPGMKPYAARYGGHQFGRWAGQLGDGRAITLGELTLPDRTRWDIQLKGAGPTPYSRSGDGRAVLRSSVREFLCSEAMHHLGVPTTRALSLVGTGEEVVRDMFYDGHPRAEPGAVVCRVAPTFLRFGNFEILAASGELELLRRLIDYTIVTYFPELGPPSPATYGRWFSDVCSRTAVMVAHWQRIGFVHGVMNTDNMSILGLTIDYGPYGWLEGYDPSWTPNTTDADRRRYCFGNQPHVAAWNLQCLAAALHPLFGPLGLQGELERGLDTYQTTFAQTHAAMTANKLGLAALQGAADEALVNDLLQLLSAVETDMTIFYRRLAAVPLGEPASSLGDAKLTQELAEAFYRPLAEDEEHQKLLADWVRRYGKRLTTDPLSPDQRLALMHRANPKFVLRNYLAQEAALAIEQKQDLGPLDLLAKVLEAPYDEQPEHWSLASKRPEWARHKPGCSTLSCSS
ncbi:MAG: YdiU family protein [Proteobacteria bacterium]|nr:YdiU family protein [Pseudomonadota bacterium]